MKVTCSHPECKNQSPELPWYNWLYLKINKLYVCKYHQELYEEWLEENK